MEQSLQALSKQENSQQNTLFLFCGRHLDRIKALCWEGDGLLFAPVFTVILLSRHPNSKLEGATCQSMSYAILDVLTF